MSLAGIERRRHLVTVGTGAALIILMGAVLAIGFRLATRMRADIAALQTAGALQTYPVAVARELDTLRERLEVRAYSGRALAELQGTVRRFDDQLRRLERADGVATAQFGQALRRWHQYAPVLDPVVSFSGQPYADSDTAGSTLSRAGRVYYAKVKHAQRFAALHGNALQANLEDLASGLQRAASDAAARLRTLLLAGVLAAIALTAAAAYLQITRARHQRSARAAQEQTRDILKTVREGFFLLDADNRIGSVWSEALTRMFGRGDFAGLSFHALLEGLVPAATLATAVKYINLLWGERAHENLMKSINPLAQLEVTTDGERGGSETRYLQFDFHRVMGPKGVRHVLVSVVDITSSVLLSRELQDSHSNANDQLDMMIGMMRTDPLQLVSFLDSAGVGLQLINTILKEPARNDAQFRSKLQGLLRELHSIKGEAAALDLKSIAERVHALEQIVGDCARRSELSGNDFLPIVLKLDDLLAHLRGVREIASRLTVIREPSGEKSADALSPTLQTMAAQLARDNAKQFTLSASGLAQVPPRYAKTVKDCLVQMLRNAAVHGIETPDVRRARSKQDAGAVNADFREVQGGYQITFEDDGAGIAPEALKQAALARKLITAAEAAAMDVRTAMALIFRPGFSTHDGISMDAGRGIGMDVVARDVYALGGKIGVSTHPGKFTRFKITLPAADAAGIAAA